MNWSNYKNGLQTKCGQYRITNFGKKGGDQYCLWKRRHNVFKDFFTKEGKDSWSQLLAVNTLKNCKEFVNANRNENFGD